MHQLLADISALHLKAAYLDTLQEVLPYVDVVKRLERAYEILTRQTDYVMHRTRTDDQVYVVQSPHATYYVNMTERTCTCPDSTDHGQLCKHRLAIRLLMKAQEYAERRVKASHSV